MCPNCKRAVAHCSCKQGKASASRPPIDGVVRVRREKKGRGGKTVTTVSGLEGTEKEVAAIAKKLKKRCGTGGSFKDWVIVIQGDRVDDVVAMLKADGHNAKQAGG